MLRKGSSDGSGVKNLHANTGDTRDLGLIPGSGRSLGGGNEKIFQYSCLKNPMNRGAWQATVHGVEESWTWPNKWAHTHTLLQKRVSKPHPGTCRPCCAGSRRETFHSWQRSWGRRLGICKGGIKPRESPRIFSSIYPQKPESAYFIALCSHLWLYWGLSPTTTTILLSLSKS